MDLSFPERHDSSFQWLNWVLNVDFNEFRQRVDSFRQLPRQQQALLLTHPASFDDDVRLALVAISHLKSPWVLSIPWRRTIPASLVSTIRGPHAARLLIHLYTAVTLGHADRRCLPSRAKQNLMTFQLQLNQNPSNQQLLKELELARQCYRRLAPAIQRQHITVLAQPNIPIKQRVAGLSTLKTEAADRGGLFRVTSLLLEDRRALGAPPFSIPHIRLTVDGSHGCHGLGLDLSVPDAKALHEALGWILRSPNKA